MNSAEPDPGNEMIGRMMLGRYRIVRHLADGGMGSIYLARNEGAAGFVRPVVIKWVLPSISSDERVTKLFMREARIMARLTHPNIVSVLDFAEEDGMYIMAMEYVHGFTLGRWARFIRKTRQPITPALAVHATIQVLDALDYAHNLSDEDGNLLRIVHRDVTPSNILIDSQGHVKLADFGIAGIASERTQVGDQSVKGKFAYMPPEAFEQVPPSAVTDVYSVGVTLHEILVGKNEFLAHGASMAEQVGRAIKHMPSRLDEVRPDVSRELADVVAQALAKSRKERYPSAAAFARALARTQNQSDVEVAVEFKRTVSGDFKDPRLSAMSSAPSLQELEGAWRGPVEPKPSTKMRALTPVGGDASSASMSIPPSALPSPVPGATPVPTAPPKRGKGWIVFAVIVGVLVLGGALAIAILAFMTTQDRGKEDPAFVVVDKRDPTGSAKPAVAPPPEVPPAAGSASARPVEPPKAPPKPPSTTDQLTRAFSARADDIAACFRQHPDAPSGEISIRFQIDVSGSVVAADVLPDKIAASALGTCIKGIAGSTSFGPQAKALTFRVPIHASGH